MLVLANAYKAPILALLRTAFNGHRIKLFKNNITPDGDTVAGDFTEANFAGYASITPLTYNAPTLNGDDQGEMVSNVIAFTCTGSSPSNDIYGYYVVDSGGALVYSERAADAPITVNTNGQVYSVTLHFLDDTLVLP